MADEKKKEGVSTSTREQGNISLPCPKLNETNYTTWALLMETMLKAYDLWEIINAKVETKIVDEKKMNTTKAMIFQTLPEDVLMQVAQYTTAKEVWEAVKVKYLGADLVQKARLQTLRSELEALKMKSNETVSDFAGKLSSLQTKFKTLGGTLKDKALVRKLLISVPKKFLPIVASIEQYQEIDTMPFVEVVGRVKAFEEHLKNQDEPEDNNQGRLLMASSSNQGRGRGCGRNSNKGASGYGRGMGRGNKDKNKFRRYECGEVGHFAKDCTKWKNKEKDNEQESNLIYDDEPVSLL
ncbi:uncharacterized protein LOC143602772 [Bidens hawaiensis]|uniref:uncharacterized protein LOC143602772 n=1 Tax=Bidens hawaiensis TaxID=980011 RepID=UPI00404A728F